MMLQKWNYETKTYEDFISPAFKVILYTEDMNEVIDCAECGKSLHFGDAFTSREIHNAMGLGYPVCKECYDEAFTKIK